MAHLSRVGHLTFSSILITSVLVFQGCLFFTDPKEGEKCNVRAKPTFGECLENKFPVGSDYQVLEDYLIREGFQKMQETVNYYDEAADSIYEKLLEGSDFQRDELVYFDFTWTPKFKLLPVPYSVRVRGFYDEDFVIVTIIAA